MKVRAARKIVKRFKSDTFAGRRGTVSRAFRRLWGDAGCMVQFTMMGPSFVSHGRETVAAIESLSKAMSRFSNTINKEAFTDNKLSAA